MLTRKEAKMIAQEILVITPNTGVDPNEMTMPKFTSHVFGYCY